MRSTRVLVVDDAPDVARLVRITLEAEGFGEVTVVNRGKDAVEVAASLQPEIVILDYAMPGMDGEECARQLRAVAPKAIIVAFSAYLPHKPSWADAWVSDKDLEGLLHVLDAGLEAGA